MHEKKYQKSLNHLHSEALYYCISPSLLSLLFLSVTLMPCKWNAKSWQAMNSRSRTSLLVTQGAGSSMHFSLLPFIAEITKYIIKLRVHKRTTITSAKPSTAVSAAAGQHSSVSQPPSMTTPESMWLWHQCSCLTAPHPLAFDWHSMQPVGALRAQAGKLALFPLIAVTSLVHRLARHSTLSLSFLAYLF